MAGLLPKKEMPSVRRSSVFVPTLGFRPPGGGAGVIGLRPTGSQRYIVRSDGCLEPGSVEIVDSVYLHADYYYLASIHGVGFL